MTSTETQEWRTSVLGSEPERRGLLRMSRPVLVARIFSMLVGVLLFLSLQGILGGLSALGLFGAVVWATTSAGGDEPSPASTQFRRIRERQRRRAGEHLFWSTADRGDRTGVPSERYDPANDPAWEHPVFLGRCDRINLSGTGYDALFVLRHNNPGELEYLSVMVQVAGIKGGLRSNASYAASSALFGHLEAEVAKPGSFVRGFAQLHRSVPFDMTPHINSYMDGIVNTDDSMAVLVDSYWSLVDRLSSLAEEHRAWFVLKFPVTGGFIAEAATRDLFGDQRRAEVGWASLIKDELERFDGLLQMAGLGEVTVLGERRSCAVIRSLQDPSWALDDDRDVDWESCWQSYVGGRDAVVINDRWHTRCAEVPKGAISPRPLGPRWLHPLLVGVEADPGADDRPSSATIRTICVRVDGVPDTVARAKAAEDVAQDGGARIADAKKGRISDGTTEVLLSSSTLRNRDLAPGSGVHGLNYSMAVSVTGRDPEDLRRSCLRVEAAAGNCGITRLHWQTDRHDVAQVVTLPLARGLAGSKDARTA